jgi:hypothetical protein
MQADRVDVVLNRLGIGFRQSGEPPLAHSHREVLALDVVGRNVIGIRVPSAAERLCALYLRRTVSTRWRWNLAIELDGLSIIDIGTKAGLDRF